MVNDGSPLRPVLHMLTPLGKVGQVLVNEVYPALQGSSRFVLLPCGTHTHMHTHTHTHTHTCTHQCCGNGN